MNRTRWIFVGIIVVALVIVGVALTVRGLGPGTGGGTPSTGGGETITVERPDAITVRVLTALPVEAWVRSAAAAYNATAPTLDGVPITVEIIAMDGLTALGRWDRNAFGALEGDRTSEGHPEDLDEATRTALDDFPTAWIPDSRYLVELANASYKERLGRDVFLTDGEYRARPIATSLFTWGLYQSRADVLEEKFGEISWNTIHDAAIAKGGWPELGGDPGWGFFKLVVPNPNKNVGGLHAMIAAAGEYYGRPDISVADVTDAEFQAWLRGVDGRRHRLQQRQRLHRRGLRALRLQRRRRRAAARGRPAAQYGGHPHPLGGPPQPLLPPLRHLVRLPLHRLGRARRPARWRRTPRWISSATCSAMSSSRRAWPMGCAPPTPTSPWTPCPTASSSSGRTGVSSRWSRARTRCATPTATSCWRCCAGSS